MKKKLALLVAFCAVAVLLQAASGIVLQTQAAPLPPSHRVPVFKVGSCVSTPPYYFVDNKGKYSGITEGYVNILEKRSGLALSRVRCTDATRLFTAVTFGDVDIVPLVERTPDLLKRMDFVFPYIQQPTVIITKHNAGFGQNLESLVGKRVVLEKFSGVKEYLENLFGNKIEVHTSTAGAYGILNSILSGDADATVLDLAVANHMLKFDQFKHFTISGYTNYVAVRGFAVSKKQPLLRTKVLETLNTITSEEQKKLHERWVSTKPVPFWQDERLIGWILMLIGGSLAIVTFILGWNESLQSTVKKRTASLEAVNNMLLRSIGSSTEYETKQICLQQFKQVMQAEHAFCGAVSDDYLHVRSATGKVPERPIHLIGVAAADKTNAVQFTLTEKVQKQFSLPNYIALKEFHTHNAAPVFIAVVKDEAFSADELLILNSLVPAFEQVLRQKQAELSLVEKDKQILRAQRMESLGTMAGGIAHDFNNILGAIIANGEMIQMFHQTEDEGVETKIESILTAAYRGRDVVRQVLDFTRPKGETIAPLWLDSVIVETEKMLRVSLPHSIQIDLDLEQAVPIMGNATQVSQIIMNLCMNSVHAMEERGGQIVMRLCSNEAIPQALLNEAGVSRKDAVLLQVQDTGTGIPAEALERVFDPFFTTKPVGVGTGLGLAMVSSIVTSYNGYVGIISNVGEGTTINILFRKADELPVVADVAVQGEPDHGVGRILYVDDDEELLFSYTEILEKIGYAVQPMVDAKQALERFKQSPNVFSMVLSDYNMPEMRGDEFASKVKEIRPDLPVILCTGYSSNFDERKASGLGLSAILNKPVSIKELAETVGQFLEPERKAAS